MGQEQEQIEIEVEEGEPPSTDIEMEEDRMANIFASEYLPVLLRSLHDLRLYTEAEAALTHLHELFQTLEISPEINSEDPAHVVEVLGILISFAHLHRSSNTEVWTPEQVKNQIQMVMQIAKHPENLNSDTVDHCVPALMLVHSTDAFEAAYHPESEEDFQSFEARQRARRNQLLARYPVEKNNPELQSFADQIIADFSLRYGHDQVLVFPFRTRRGKGGLEECYAKVCRELHLTPSEKKDNRFSGLGLGTPGVALIGTTFRGKDQAFVWHEKMHLRYEFGLLTLGEAVEEGLVESAACRKIGRIDENFNFTGPIPKDYDEEVEFLRYITLHFPQLAQALEHRFEVGKENRKQIRIDATAKCFASIVSTLGLEWVAYLYMTASEPMIPLFEKQGRQPTAKMQALLEKKRELLIA